MSSLIRFSLAATLLFLTGCGSTQSAGYAGAPSPSYSDGIAISGRSQAEPPGSETERKLIRDATLVLEVGSSDEVKAVLEGARAVAESVEGYVSVEDSRSMTLRIPDARLDDALERLSTLGEVDRREIRSQDVTASYTDLQIRLDNALALQARLRTLLDRAETVSDVVEVETALSRVTLEVERLEGQKRLLDNQIAYSTVRLSVYDGATPGPLGWVVVGLYETVKWLFVWE